jgi:LPS-assembly protein
VKFPENEAPRGRRTKARGAGAAQETTQTSAPAGLKPARAACVPAALWLPVLAAALALRADPAAAQLGKANSSDSAGPPPTGNLPVTFLADSVTYDKDNGIVSATGHVQAWQNGHYLSADRVTFDRNTGVAAARGHVLIVEPDGQIVFGDYAELSAGMKNGVISGMRSLLADNGKLAANGARRTEGKLNELSRAVYSSCNVCALHPDRAPEWQIQADHITQDLENKRIEYYDAWLELYGYPVFYLPYMSSTDPSVKRQSGFLIPSVGYDTDHIGSFFSIPYYWVIDGQSDMTFTPEVNTMQGGQLGVEYRNAMNDGAIKADGAIARDNRVLAGYFFGHANFEWDDTWRYGVNINLGSSINYMRDYQVEGFAGAFLVSNAYIEGFGIGSYSKLDVVGWQGLNSSITQTSLPYVLPRYVFNFFGEPNILGGRVYLDTMGFDVLRGIGTDVQRAAVRLGWDRTLNGPLGDQWLFTTQVAGAAYHTENLNEEPNYGSVSNADSYHAQPQVAAKVNWPFIRDSGSLGSQIIEPIVQLVAAPQAGNSRDSHLPNEDSLDYEFTDSTLFSLNRFGGYDRFDGGERANFALHGNWTFRGGQQLDALIGASVIEHIDHNQYPQFQPWNGFEKGSHLSDVVGRLSFIPNKWVDFTTRARIDQQNGDLRFGEAVAGAGIPLLRVSAGYLWSSTNPYSEYVSDFYLPQYALTPTNPNQAQFFTPRSEVTAGVSTQFSRYTFSANARYDVETDKWDTAGAHAKYEDECTIFDILYSRRYTSIGGDHGNTTVLLTITLKTLGQITAT